MTTAADLSKPALDPDADCITDLGRAPTAEELDQYLHAEGLATADTVTTVNYARTVLATAQVLNRMLANRHALLRVGHTELVARAVTCTLEELTDTARLLAQWLLGAQDDGECDPAPQQAAALMQAALAIRQAAGQIGDIAFPADRLPPMTPGFLAERVHQVLAARDAAAGPPQSDASQVCWPLRGNMVLLLDSQTDRPGGPWQLRRGGANGQRVSLGLPQVTYVHPAVAAGRVADTLAVLGALGPQTPPGSLLPGKPGTA